MTEKNSLITFVIVLSKVHHSTYELRTQQLLEYAGRLVDDLISLCRHGTVLRHLSQRVQITLQQPINYRQYRCCQQVLLWLSSACYAYLYRLKKFQKANYAVRFVKSIILAYSLKNSCIRYQLRCSTTIEKKFSSCSSYKQKTNLLLPCTKQTWELSECFRYDNTS